MLLIFDWDGTLADSQEHIVNAMQAAIEALQLPEHSRESCAQMIGLGLSEVALRLFPGAGVDAHQAFIESYSYHFTRLRQQYGGTQFFPDAISTLNALHTHGHQLAIATGKSRRGLNRVLDADNIAHLFAATRAADETASKPNPLMLEEILSETGVGVGDAVMIGDTSYDLEMARNLDMRRIGVSYGVHHVEVLREYKPAIIIDSLAELLQWPALR